MGERQRHAHTQKLGAGRNLLDMRVVDRDPGGNAAASFLFVSMPLFISISPSLPLSPPPSLSSSYLSLSLSLAHSLREIDKGERPGWRCGRTARSGRHRALTPSTTYTLHPLHPTPNTLYTILSTPTTPYTLHPRNPTLYTLETRVAMRQDGSKREASSSSMPRNSPSLSHSPTHTHSRHTHMPTLTHRHSQRESMREK